MLRIVKLHAGYRDRPDAPRLEIWTPIDRDFYDMPMAIRKRGGTDGGYVWDIARIGSMVDQTLMDQYNQRLTSN